MSLPLVMQTGHSVSEEAQDELVDNLRLVLVDLMPCSWHSNTFSILPQHDRLVTEISHLKVKSC